MKLKLPLLKYNKAWAGIAIGMLFASAFFYAGYQYKTAAIPQRLPANNACVAYAQELTKALSATQNEIVQAVQDKPYVKTDIEIIKKQRKDCLDSVDNYNVTVKASQK